MINDSANDSFEEIANNLPAKNLFIYPFFVTFEGVDGCGKTLMIQKLQNFCESNKIRYQICSEKQNDIVLEKIFKNPQKISQKLQLLYWWQSRRSLLEKYYYNFFNWDISLLIFDRYYDSTFVYQNLEYNTIESKFNFNEGLFPTPDLTFYLQVDYQTAITRMDKRHSKRDLYEEDLKNIEKYINRYDTLYYKKHETDRPYDLSHVIEIIDANLSEPTVTEIIISRFKKLYFEYIKPFQHRNRDAIYSLENL